MHLMHGKRYSESESEYHVYLLWLLPPIGGKATYLVKMSENSDLDSILTQCFPVEYLGVSTFTLDTHEFSPFKIRVVAKHWLPAKFAR